MSAEVMLLLIAEPESAERLSDLLAEAGLAEGWYESAVDLVGGQTPYRNQRERVRGRRPRVRFEVFVAAEAAKRLIAEIRKRFPDDPQRPAPQHRVCPEQASKRALKRNACGHAGIFSSPDTITDTINDGGCLFCSSTSRHSSATFIVISCATVVARPIPLQPILSAI